MSRFLFPILAMVCAGRAHAQSAFDVASIRRAAVSIGREGGNRARIEHTPTSLRMSNVSLNECVQWAYGVASFQVSGRPLSGETYDILAKTGSPVPVGQLRAMLQSLLAARFKLALRRESRDLPVFELVAAKGGPKLPARKESSSAARASESLPRVENDSFVFADVTLAEFDGCSRSCVASSCL